MYQKAIGIRPFFPELLSFAKHVCGPEGPDRERAQLQGGGSCGSRATPSYSAACCQGQGRSSGGTVAGAVSRMNRSSAATTAAASSGEAPGATIENFGRRFTVAPRVSWPARA